MSARSACAVVPLGSVCDIAMGQAPDGSSYNRDGNGVPLVGGASDLGAVHPQPRQFTTSPTKLCSAGDLILCIRATIGDTNWADTTYCLGRGVAGLRARPDRLHDRFLMYALRHMTPTMLKFARGSTFKQIDRNTLVNLRVPLPPIEEQRRIAAILDSASCAHGQRHRQVALFDALVRSLYVDRFGESPRSSRWPVKSLGELVATATYGTAQPANDDGKGLPLLRMCNVTYEGWVDLTDLRWCEIRGSDRDAHTVRRGDLLFNRTNSPELVGKCAVWDRDDEFAYAGYLVRARFQPDLAVPEYVCAFLNSAYGKSYLASHAKPSNNMSNFSAGAFLQIPLPVPPLDDQQKFAQIYRRAGALRQRVSGAVAETKVLSDVLADAAFRGEV